MKLKKFASLGLAVLMTVGTLAGCNNGSEGGKEEVSIAYWDIETMMKKGEDDKILQEIEDGAGVKIKPVNITWDDYRDKIQLWASSNQLPDLFAVDVVGSQYYYDWIEQGVVSPLPDDLSKWPTLQAYLDTPEIQALRAEDGKMYAIPRKQWEDIRYGALERKLYYRWDLAQAAGVTKEPETYDEFRDMMKKIVEADPENKDVQGLTVSTPQLFDNFFMNYAVPLGWGAGNEYKWVQNDEGTWVPAYFNGDLKSVFQLARDMFQEGSVEPDVALAKTQLSNDKFMQGKVAAIYLNSSTEAMYKKWSDANPDIDFFENIKMAKPFPMKDGKTTIQPVFNTYWSETYLGTKDPEKIEKCLDLMEWILKNENLVRYGFEGEDYEVVDGKIKQKDPSSFGEKYPASGFGSLVEYNSITGYVNLTDDPMVNKCREMDLEYIEWVKENCEVPEFDLSLTTMTTPTKRDFSLNSGDDLMSVMTGTDPVDQMYEEIIQNYKDMGLEQMIEEVNQKANSK